MPETTDSTKLCTYYVFSVHMFKKFQLGKFEDLIGFYSRNSWIGQHPIQQQKNILQGLYKMNRFYRKKGEARELLTTEKEQRKRWLLVQDTFSFRERTEGFVSCRFCFLSKGDGEDPQWQNTRKFKTSLLKLYFWERLKWHLDQVLNLDLVLRTKKKREFYEK